jgi:hypothetical protein
MGENNNDFDVEGHRIPVTPQGEDVEGHRDRAGDEDDVEGHVQPPRDTDLGNAPR